MSFLAGVVHQLEAFANSSKVDRDDVAVRFTFADGDVRLFKGLQVDDVAGDGWGMIRGSKDDTPRADALVIRESHIIKVEFDLSRQAEPIGLHTEVS